MLSTAALGLLIPASALSVGAIPLPARGRSFFSRSPALLDGVLGSGDGSDLLGGLGNVGQLGNLGDIAGLGSLSNLAALNGTTDAINSLTGGALNDIDLSPLLGQVSTTTEDLVNPVLQSTGLGETLGQLLDLTVGSTLLCANVEGQYDQILYALGCACLGVDGNGLLLQAGAVATTPVAGLEGWVQSQISYTGKQFEYPADSQPSCDGDGGYDCPFGKKANGDRSCASKLASHPQGADDGEKDNDNGDGGDNGNGGDGNGNNNSGNGNGNGETSAGGNGATAAVASASSSSSSVSQTPVQLQSASPTPAPTTSTIAAVSTSSFDAQAYTAPASASSTWTPAPSPTDNGLYDAQSTNNNGDDGGNGDTSIVSWTETITQYEVGTTSTTTVNVPATAYIQQVTTTSTTTATVYDTVTSTSITAATSTTTQYQTITQTQTVYDTESCQTVDAASVNAAPPPSPAPAPSPSPTVDSAPAPLATDESDDPNSFSPGPKYASHPTCPSDQEWKDTMCCRPDQDEVDRRCQCPSGSQDLLNVCVSVCLGTDGSTSDLLGLDVTGCVNATVNVGSDLVDSLTSGAGLGSLTGNLGGLGDVGGLTSGLGDLGGVGNLLNL